MKHTDIINSLSLEQKCALLSGGTVFTTRALPGKGIPAITLSDGPNGVRKQAGAADHLGLNPSVPATCFPTSATVANSWDPELGEAVGAAMGEEAAAQGVSVLLGPGLNIKRSPLCGRNFEYFSEDPYLAGKMAAAYVRGIQKNGIAACPKHFAVNSQELRRMASDSIVDERTLREIYLTGFEMVVKEAQPKTIMSAYNLVNGTYANENTHLLMDILRGDWGFDGAVVTDWGGSNDHALGVKNGSTLEMPAPGGDAIRELMKAVQTGKITEADVDARLEELLELVFTTKAAVDAAPGKFDADAHHALARRAAAQSIVLLKNENSLLPLAKGEKVAVIGDFAQTPRYQGAGSSAVNSIKVDSFLDCLAESGLNSVGYAKGFDRQGKPDEALKAEAVLLAKNADVVLLCMGLDEIKESEGHRPRRHEAGREPAGTAGGCGSGKPQRGGAAERRLLAGKRLGQGLQGAGLRLPGRSGRCGRTGRGADRCAEPLRQAGGDLGAQLRRHPRKGAFRRRRSHCGVPRGAVCGLPLLRHCRCAHRLPLRLRPELYQLCVQ